MGAFHLYTHFIAVLPVKVRNSIIRYRLISYRKNRSVCAHAKFFLTVPGPLNNMKSLGSQNNLSVAICSFCMFHDFLRIPSSHTLYVWISAIHIFITKCHQFSDPDTSLKLKQHRQRRKLMNLDTIFKIIPCHSFELCFLDSAIMVVECFMKLFFRGFRYLPSVFRMIFIICICCPAAVLPLFDRVWVPQQNFLQFRFFYVIFHIA